jgi:hypothetical protein
MRVILTALAVLVAAGVAWPVQAPLPDTTAFLREVRVRLASNDELRAGYAYRERRTQINLNPFGRMGSGPVELFEVFPGPEPELTYRRLIERDGRALGPREIAEQDREHLAKLERHRRERARESARDRARREAREAEERAEAAERSDEVLALFDYRIVRRDRHDAHPAIVLEFEPKPDASPRSREARVAAVFKGRAWIHEHLHELMRLEATAMDDVSFGFGMIARLHEGATTRILRHQFEPGRWLPAESRFEGTGRALLFRRVTFNSVHEFFDYRPFDPSQLAAMLAGHRDVGGGDGER